MEPQRFGRWSFGPDLQNAEAQRSLQHVLSEFLSCLSCACFPRSCSMPTDSLWSPIGSVDMACHEIPNEAAFRTASLHMTAASQLMCNVENSYSCYSCYSHWTAIEQLEQLRYSALCVASLQNCNFVTLSFFKSLRNSDCPLHHARTLPPTLRAESQISISISIVSPCFPMFSGTRLKNCKWISHIQHCLPGVLQDVFWENELDLPRCSEHSWTAWFVQNDKVTVRHMRHMPKSYSQIHVHS